MEVPEAEEKTKVDNVSSRSSLNSPPGQRTNKTVSFFDQTRQKDSPPLFTRPQA